MVEEVVEEDKPEEALVYSTDPEVEVEEPIEVEPAEEAPAEVVEEAPAEETAE